MYFNRKISVAMATYNGEKYIKNQLLSIINQTVSVDEIIISDDGSTDSTISIINEIALCNSNVSFTVLSDNKNHGPKGNFEHALVNCTGDYIFLADQDDIWKKEKVEHVISVFLKNPDVHFVCHDADLIDKNNSIIQGVFNKTINGFNLGVNESQYIKISKEQFFSIIVYRNLTNGMVMCISSWLKNQVIPFPETFTYHDWWIMVVALKYDSCVFLNEVLTDYRLHENNTVGNNSYSGNLADRIKKKIRMIKMLKQNSLQTLYHLNTLKLLINENDLNEKEAYENINVLYHINTELISIESCGRLQASFKLLSLYMNNMRYRRTGINSLLQELLYILLNNKETRIENLHRMGNHD